MPDPQIGDHIEPNPNNFCKSVRRRLNFSAVRMAVAERTLERCRELVASGDWVVVPQSTHLGNSREPTDHDEYETREADEPREDVRLSEPSPEFRWVQTGHRVFQLESPPGSRMFHGIVYGDIDPPMWVMRGGFTRSHTWKDCIEYHNCGTGSFDECKRELESRLLRPADEPREDVRLEPKDP